VWPDYTWGCKRILFSSWFLPALARENVELVTEPLAHFYERGIATSSGTERDVDCIIYGTGFGATQFLTPMQVSGRGGLSLRQAWRDGAQAYLGITVAGFPNFFMLYGPNTNLGGNSIIYMLEGQIGYVLGALQALMPRGRLWPRDPDARQTMVLAGLAPSLARLVESMNALLVDAFPASTEHLLPEWEATLGLPDPCAGALPTIEARRAQVLARFIGTGGQSVSYYVAVATALGYPITVTEFTPFRLGQPLGQPLNGEAWAYAWQINAPTFTVEYFELGTSALGEPFAYWSNNVLQCEMQRLKPAHTQLTFAYS